MALRVQKRGSRPNQGALSSGERPSRSARLSRDIEATKESPKPVLRRLDLLLESQEVTAVDVDVNQETKTTQTVQVLHVLHEEPKQPEPTHTKPLPTIPPPRLDAGEPTAILDREAERRESTLVMPSAPPKPPPGPDPAKVRRVRIALAVAWLAIVGVTVLTLRTRRELRTTHVVATQAVKLTTTAEPTAIAAPATKESPATEPAPSAAASEAPPAPAGDQGVVVTAQAAPGRRVWIDERLMTEQTPDSFTVRCGKHHVRIGSSGKSQPIEVPCGGEVAVK